MYLSEWGLRYNFWSQLLQHTELSATAHYFRASGVILNKIVLDMDNSNAQARIVSQKPLKQVILEQGSELQQVENPQTGKQFFVCGNIRGFIAPAAVERFNNNNVTVDDFKIAMVAKGDDKPIPSLLINEQKGFKLVRTFEVSQVLAPNPPDDDMID